ncbi:hypothetical protein [Paenibacillus sp. FSL H7-0918]|uniref:hypothetical protein n=1 Tax=Paenibacillus sp. FSL H7-0918 TaxID=2921442 RepID=UPI0030F577F3
MSRERESYLIEVVPIQHQDEQTIPEEQEQWSLEDVCSYLGVPAGMIKTIKANERESHEMYREFIKTNFPFHICVDLTPGTDKTVIRKVDSHGQCTGQQNHASHL